jgi:hypothetical protein
VRRKRRWNSVTGGWAWWFEWTDCNFQPLTNWFREAAGLTGDQGSRQIFTDFAWKARMASLSDSDAARFADAVNEAVQPFVKGWTAAPDCDRGNRGSLGVSEDVVRRDCHAREPRSDKRCSMEPEQPLPKRSASTAPVAIASLRMCWRVSPR